MILMAWALAVAATPATGLQAKFEQATAALQARQWDAALSQFQAIETMPTSLRTRGVVLLREGTALMRMHRDGEAVQAFRKGLALVPKTDSTLNEDRFDALIALGGLDRGYYDYAAAKREFAEAQTLADDVGSKIRAMLPLASVTMFDDVATAHTLMDELTKITASAKLTAQVDAAINDMRGRVLLNQGNAAAALAAFRIAVKDM